MDRERRYKLWLAFALGDRIKRQNSLLEEYGSAEAVFHAAKAGKIQQLIRGDDILIPLLKNKAEESYIDRCLAYLEKHKIDTVLMDDANYPVLLREITMPPMVLYVKGRLPERIDLPIAVIGSRDCSQYGANIAASISGELAACGVCVVSGLARGIDCTSAEAALDNAPKDSFPTVAVLGSGVDVFYPAENRRLYDRICERGAVISEFPPGTSPERFNFPRRNRIISGMSKGVLVVEAAKKSGTRITVDYALEQGRDVFAVPGRITDETCQGTNEMIRDGIAKLVNEAEDVLVEYGIRAAARKKAEDIDIFALSVEEALIVKLLKARERTVDELIEMTGMDTGILNSTLTGMEISGIIKQSPGRLYSL